MDTVKTQIPYMSFKAVSGMGVGNVIATITIPLTQRTKLTCSPYENVHLKKNDKIESAGFNFVEVYECELNNKDKDFKKFMKTWDRDIVGPLNPRDAFFGGRTNVTKLTYDFKQTEKGRYVDFVSLYPTVQYYKRYPVGHPERIFEPLSYDNDWFGFIKCKVLPPRGLYHPVLPVKIQCGSSHKLLFPLCGSCAETKQQKCNHSDGEREFIGTWCTNEIETALGKRLQDSKDL